MNDSTFRCVFLSARGVDPEHIDDHLALAPLAEHGVHIETISWQDTTVAWADYDAVVVRSTWDYHAQDDAFFDALAHIDQQTALLNPLSVMQWNRRKTYLRDLAGAGLPVVDSVFGEALTPLKLDVMAARFADEQWIIKPIVGASSHGVFRLSGSPDAGTREAMLARFKKDGYLAQPFVPSVLDPGEFSVFFFGGHYSHTICKTPKKGDFRVQEDYGGHIVAVEPDEALLRTAREVHAHAAAECLYSRVDLVSIGPDAYAVMEVELIEPSLYLRICPDAARNFAQALRAWLDAAQLA